MVCVPCVRSLAGRRCLLLSLDSLPPLLPSPHCPCVPAPPACLPCSQNALRKKYWTLTKKQADSDSEAMELTGGRCLQLPCCCLQLPCP